MDDDQFYRALRSEAYQQTQILHPGLRLTEIDTKAVEASVTRGYTWAWDEDDNAHLAARFEVAVWENADLTGMCRGKPIEDNRKLCLEIVEAAPNIPLAARQPVLPAISLCALVYAKLIGAAEVRLLEPTSLSRIRLYERLGYRYVAAGHYLVKEVTS